MRLQVTRCIERCGAFFCFKSSANFPKGLTLSEMSEKLKRKGKTMKEQNLKKRIIVVIIEIKKSDKPPKHKKVRMKFRQKREAMLNESPSVSY
jgi:hypothetical protein